MSDRPFPPETAAAVRRYIGAFLSAQDATDAMHDVVADVRYWGDSGHHEVLRIAHGVMVARARLTDEVAWLTLVEEVGLTADEAAAVVGLDTPPDLGDLAPAVPAAPEPVLDPVEDAPPTDGVPAPPTDGVPTPPTDDVPAPSTEDDSPPPPSAFPVDDAPAPRMVAFGETDADDVEDEVDEPEPVADEPEPFVAEFDLAEPVAEDEPTPAEPPDVEAPTTVDEDVAIMQFGFEEEDAGALRVDDTAPVADSVVADRLGLLASTLVALAVAAVVAALLLLVF